MDQPPLPCPPPPAREPSFRERLSRGGPAHLDERDLLALVIGSGTRSRPLAQLARELLQRHAGLAGLAALPADALRREHGVGPGLAARLAALFEIARRLADPAAARHGVRDPADAAREVRDLADERREHLVGLYLDAHARLIARETVAIGSLNVARASPRDVLEPAFRHLASGIVLAHNHPSGSPEPSEDDVLFTRSVGRAANLMGIPLWDHLVIARAGHVSLRARGIAWEGQDAGAPLTAAGG